MHVDNSRRGLISVQPPTEWMNVYELINSELWIEA